MRADKKKCYVAGPITGLTIHDYTDNFNRGKMLVKGLGFKPIVPIELRHTHDKSYLNYMRADITALLKCDAVFALKGWEKSNGASIEVNLAIGLKIPVYYEAVLPNGADVVIIPIAG